jgi:hypothetical protein
VLVHPWHLRNPWFSTIIEGAGTRSAADLDEQRHGDQQNCETGGRHDNVPPQPSLSPFFGRQFS